MEDSAERYPVLPSSCSPAVAISTPLAPLGMSDLDGYSVEEDQSIVRVATTANGRCKPRPHFKVTGHLLQRPPHPAAADDRIVTIAGEGRQTSRRARGS